MSKFDKRLGYIVDVLVQDGAVICRVEDKDTPNKVYDPVLYGRSSPKAVSVPPKGTQAMVERVSGEWIITNIISTPSESGFDEEKAKTGFENEAASMSLVFGPREGADGPEYINIEYNQDGYQLDVNVDGNITVETDERMDVTVGTGSQIDITEELNAETGGRMDLIVGDGSSIDIAKNLDIEVNGNATIEATDGFTILDGDGYGIEALDGAGEFKWYANNVDFDSTNTGSTQ